MPKNIHRKLVLGQILNPLQDEKCAFHMNGALVLVKKGGGWVVDYVGDASNAPLKLDMTPSELENVEILDFKRQIIMPSFFDIHFHWVQDDVRTMPKASLLEWLEKHTFPAERKFEKKNYSKRKAKEFFKRLVQTGTLGGAIYSSIHEHALEHAQEQVVGHFAIGNVQMTMNSPDFLTQTKEEAIDLSVRMAKKYKDNYALTPRFAIATDPETMRQTAIAAKENGSFIQTHLSENKGEIEFVMQIYKNMPEFKNVKNYTDIYDKVGLLGPKTIMGHGIHLSDEEMKKIAKTKTVIAHCPTSNAPIRQKGLGSGLFDFKKAQKRDIRWALASDIGGGPVLSMFDVMRSFVDQNAEAGIKVSYAQALYRSTVAGAEAMGVEKIAGNFTKGKEANFLVLAPVKGEVDTAEEVLERIVSRGRRNRSAYDDLPRKVFFKGEALYER
ncbi:MAG: amidohydrolase family protein [Bacteriovoracaceae bacterium]